MTHEAAPLNQPAPSLTPLGPNVVSVRWQPPHRPNGLIQGYTVYRRLAQESSTAYTVHIGDNNTFRFTNAGPGMWKLMVDDQCYSGLTYMQSCHIISLIMCCNV